MDYRFNQELRRAFQTPTTIQRNRLYTRADESSAGHRMYMWSRQQRRLINGRVYTQTNVSRSIWVMTLMTYNTAHVILKVAGVSRERLHRRFETFTKFSWGSSWSCFYKTSPWVNTASQSVPTSTSICTDAAPISRGEHRDQPISDRIRSSNDEPWVLRHTMLSKIVSSLPTRIWNIFSKLLTGFWQVLVYFRAHRFWRIFGP
jgi:hypothetical protein